MYGTKPGKPLDTPPSSDVEASPRLPPSPPLSPKKSNRSRSLSAVERLLRTVRLCRAGQLDSSTGDWQTFTLSRAEFAELEQRLRKEEALWRWYEEKARYDWEEGRGECIVRMPTALHECFIARVEDGLAGRIGALAGKVRGDDEELAVELDKIYKGRSTTVELRVPELENSSQDTSSSADGRERRVVRRSPDATFYHRAQPHIPSLVLEVSYSQQRKDLPRLAESYVVDSRHAIRCVVGLDIPYAKVGGKKKQGPDETRQATLSVWRPGVEARADGEDEIGICTCDIDSQPFRDADGTPCDGTLELGISDILPSAISDALSSTQDSVISIPFADLNAFLLAAEAEASKAPSVAPSASTAPKRFRKRKRTPSEELSDSREAEYARLEEREVLKDRAVDGEWLARNHPAKDGEVEVVERRKSRRRNASRVE